MSNTQEALRKALEALEYHQEQTRPIQKTQEAIAFARKALAATADLEQPDLDHLVSRLRSYSRAYPEDIFTPLTPEETEQYSNIVTRTSAGMGRHVSNIMAEAADEIERMLASTQVREQIVAQNEAEAIALAQAAINVMTEFHSHAEPDDTPDMNALFPAAAFRRFVDEHARMIFRLAQFKNHHAEPAYLRLRSAANEVCAVLGAHGEISATDDRVQSLMDALYGTDDAAPEKAKSVYVSSHIREHPAIPEGLMEAIDEAVDSVDGLLKWCVANVNKWDFPEYDYASRKIEKLRKVAAPSPENKQ